MGWWTDRVVPRVQDRLQPVHGRLAGGCHLTRDVTAELGGAGLLVEDLRSGYLPGPRPSLPFGHASTGHARVS